MSQPNLFSPEQLRAKAAAYRSESQRQASLLPYLMGAARREQHQRIARFRDLAADLERAAQKLEAISV